AAASRAAGLRSMLAALERARREAERQAAAEAARAARQKHSAEAEAAHRTQQALAVPTGPGTIAAGAHASGQLMMPVVGRVVQHFASPTAAGPATGIAFQAPPAARVVSPCSGRVEFAAPFHSYGLLVIVACGGGYHAVLGGMESLATSAGRAVHIGAPVGTMPRWNPASGQAPPHLYMELRRGGTAVDPMPWFAHAG
ncbi:MAG: peptidoglycan DD-metalloendopeptidase family protein, partial [Rhodospirillales bacterium]|nr:peptidoglycan DD-metalloendopeptidase family protein [Rhodospirillales bacterium]